jgi:cyclase
VIRNGAAVPRYRLKKNHPVETCGVLAVAIASSLALSAHAQGTPPITRLAPDIYLIVAPSGTMVAQTGPSGIVLAGAQSKASTAGVVAALRTVSTAPVRYVVFAPGDSMGDEGDAGWSERKATIVAHERMRMTAPHVTSALGFSEVLQIYLDGGSVHVVHQPPGHTKADIIVHFETMRVLYLGYAFVAKGYPRIDVGGGASIDSLIKEVAPFAGFAGVQIVPGRGPVSTAADVGAYRDMLAGVREKVSALIAQKKTLAEAIAAKPTAQWDATYGRTGARPDQFVEMVYRSLTH